MLSSANTTTPECKTVFARQLLSQESRLQEQNVFLFFDSSVGKVNLCGGINLVFFSDIPELITVGLNLARFEDLTIAKFYKWMTLVDSHKHHSPPILIWPIKVAKLEHDVLHYYATRVGQPLSRTSDELMPPGNYAAYCGMI